MSYNSDNWEEVLGSIESGFGTSLYLSSSQKMRDDFITNLQQQMGFGFHAYLSGTTDFDREKIGYLLGEIEIFYAKQGHFTDWHTDF